MTDNWINPADRLQSLPQYVFARLDELKANARKQGVDLIDLGMGNPDGPPPAPVIAAAKAALDEATNHGDRFSEIGCAFKGWVAVICGFI